MEPNQVKTPWIEHLGDVPSHLDYFQGTMYEAVEKIAEKYPSNVAFDFMGKSTTYRTLIERINACAKSLRTIGVRKGDRVTIAMPNCPQAIYMYGSAATPALSTSSSPVSRMSSADRSGRVTC